MKRNVLITGAVGGIGKSICMSLLIKKYNLILVGRNKNKLDGFLEDHQSVIKRITCDLRDKAEIKKLYESIVNDELQIDILINNAGITDDSLFIRMNYEKWENVIETNLTQTSC